MLQNGKQKSGYRLRALLLLILAAAFLVCCLSACNGDEDIDFSYPNLDKRPQIMGILESSREVYRVGEEFDFADIEMRVILFGEASETLIKVSEADVVFAKPEFWNVTEDGKYRIDTPGVYTYTIDYLRRTSPYTITIVEDLTFTVSFMQERNSVEPMATESVACGSLLTFADFTPEKEGYSLVGWYYDNNFTRPFNPTTDVVLKTRTVYARWMPNQYDVTYVPDPQNVTNGAYHAVNESGETVAFSTTAKHFCDASLTLPKLAAEGEAFLGWYEQDPDTLARTVFKEKTMPARALTLYGAWSKPTITATAGLSGTGEERKAVMGSAVTLRISWDSQITTNPALRWYVMTAGASSFTPQLQYGSTLSYTPSTHGPISIYATMEGAASNIITFDAEYAPIRNFALTVNDGRSIIDTAHVCTLPTGELSALGYQISFEMNWNKNYAGTDYTFAWLVNGVVREDATDTEFVYDPRQYDGDNFTLRNNDVITGRITSEGGQQVDYSVSLLFADDTLHLSTVPSDITRCTIGENVQLVAEVGNYYSGKRIWRVRYESTGYWQTLAENTDDYYAFKPITQSNCSVKLTVNNVDSNVLDFEVAAAAVKDVTISAHNVVREGVVPLGHLVLNEGDECTFTGNWNKSTAGANKVVRWHSSSDDVTYNAIMDGDGAPIATYSITIPVYSGMYLKFIVYGDDETMTYTILQIG